jgi:hypothetical protein
MPDHEHSLDNQNSCVVNIKTNFLGPLIYVNIEFVQKENGKQTNNDRANMPKSRG